MAFEFQVEAGSPRRNNLPSLTQLCQRVAGTHVEAISSLGELRFDLVAPILERCSIEHLLRLEQASPHLQMDTNSIWRASCFRKYPTMIQRYDLGERPEPQSWRDEYFVLQEAEAKRLEEIAQRLRTQRHEADERRKEREVKLTDLLPPPKRARTAWGVSVQPKSLFQRTRSEASKIQKNIYRARMVPPMPPNGKDYRAVLKSPCVSLLPSPNPTFSSRVVVNSVIQKRRLPDSASSSAPTLGNSSATSSEGESPTSGTRHIPLPLNPPSPEKLTAITPSESRPLKPPSSKRDPMAALFLPKHRAHSQLVKKPVPLR